MYVVIELQTLEDGSIANLVTAHNSWNEAEAKYHSVLSAAALSNLPCHAAVILDNQGGLVESMNFPRRMEDMEG